jgi:enoyl-[acyl-carrier protein] reductase I
VLLQDKIALIYGVANHRSFAWHAALALAREGARLAITYQGERLENDVRKLADTLPNGALVVPCDVTDDGQIQAVYERVGEEFGGLDCLFHAVAFARREDLAGRYLDTSREGYALAHDISTFSLVAVTRPAVPLFEKHGGGSVITMTYLGGERAVPRYNVMGVAKAALDASVRYLALDLGEKNIRVNAISAGPVSTLAARGIAGFTDILQVVRERSPLRRNIDQDEVADTAVFLASHWSRGITGEVLHVDAGYSIVGI